MAQVVVGVFSGGRGSPCVQVVVFPGGEGSGAQVGFGGVPRRLLSNRGRRLIFSIFDRKSYFS